MKPVPPALRNASGERASARSDRGGAAPVVVLGRAGVVVETIMH